MFEQAVLDEIVSALVSASWKERDAYKVKLIDLGRRQDKLSVYFEALELKKAALTLELRWELDEVIEELTPVEPAPIEEEEAPEPEADAPLKASDLQLIFDDPRGVQVYKTKKAPERWFLSQMDPYSGQPQMMELQAPEIEQVKAQFKGSPYWVLGSGV